MSDTRDRVLARAVAVYGETLTVEARRRTETTLQGRMETGYVVYGRAYGGDQIGCLYPTRGAARAAIAKAEGGE